MKETPPNRKRNSNIVWLLKLERKKPDGKIYHRFPYDIPKWGIRESFIVE